MGKPDSNSFPFLGGDPTDTFTKDWQLYIDGIPCGIYLDEGDGIIERCPETGREATVQFICQWNQRLDFMAALLGTVDYGGGQVIRQDPFSYPVSTADQELTFTNRLICTSVSNIRGLHWWTDGTGGSWGAAGATVADPALPGWGGYVFAVVTAEFTTPLYWITSDPDTPNFDDLLAQTYLITKMKAGGEILAPPFGSIIYDNPGGPHDAEPVLDIGAVQIRTRSEVSCTRVRMPIVPTNAIIAAMNSVNNDVIKIGGYPYPKGSVLLNNVVPTPRSDPFEGGIIWDLEYVFLANAPAGTGQIFPVGGANPSPLDWNAYLDKDGNWQYVKTSGTGNRPFRYVDWQPGGVNDIFSDTIS